MPPCTPADAIRALERDFKENEINEKMVSQDDLRFLEKLEQGITQTEKGHYEMPLPFKERPQMPDNRQLAESRLNQLKRKLMRDEKYKRDYVTYMNDIIQRGDAEETDDNGPEGETWYIPHHGIYHSKKPERLRVVFDCSARHKGTCLNDHLLNGPDMINNLTGVLVRFRQHQVALMCDIEKNVPPIQSQYKRSRLSTLFMVERRRHEQTTSSLSNGCTSLWRCFVTWLCKLRI